MRLLTASAGCPRFCEEWNEMYQMWWGTFCAWALANLSSRSSFCMKPEPDCETADPLSAASFTNHTCLGAAGSRLGLHPSQHGCLATQPYWNLSLLVAFSVLPLLENQDKQVHTPLFTDGSCAVTLFFNSENFIEFKEQWQHTHSPCFRRSCSALGTVDPNTASGSTSAH